MNGEDLVARLLLRLDTNLSDSGIVSAEEITDWPQTALTTLVEAGILRPIEPANWVTCEACPEDHGAEVIRRETDSSSPPRFFIFCPEYGGVEVDPERLRQWRIEPAGLAGWVGRSLGIAKEPKILVPGRLYHLGASEFAGEIRDFFLARGLYRPERQLDLEEHLRGYATAVVFTTNESVPAASEMAIVPLSRLASLESEALVFDRAYLEGLLASPTASTTETGNLLRREGDFWILRYQGRSYRPIRHVKGMNVLAYLLRNPHQPYHVMELRRLSDAGEGVLPVLTPFLPDELQGDVRGISRQAVLDRSGIGQLKGRRRAARDKRQKALSVGDLDEAKAAEEELELVTSLLGQLQNNRGRERPLADEGEKARSALTRQLDRALKKIEEVDKDLARELHRSIRRGFTYVYHPQDGERWVESD